MKTSVCNWPFIRTSASPSPQRRAAVIPASSSPVVSWIVKPEMSQSSLAASARIASASPTNTGIIIPALVASSAASIGNGAPARAIATRGAAKPLARSIRFCGQTASRDETKGDVIVTSYEYADETQRREGQKKHDSELPKCRGGRGQELTRAQPNTQYE